MRVSDPETFDPRNAAADRYRDWTRVLIQSATWGHQEPKLSKPYANSSPLIAWMPTSILNEGMHGRIVLGPVRSILGLERLEPDLQRRPCVHNTAVMHPVIVANTTSAEGQVHRQRLCVAQQSTATGAA